MLTRATELVLSGDMNAKLRLRREFPDAAYDEVASAYADASAVCRGYLEVAKADLRLAVQQKLAQLYDRAEADDVDAALRVLDRVVKLNGLAEPDSHTVQHTVWKVGFGEPKAE